NTKVTTYCLLRQIHEALGARLNVISGHVAWPTARSLIEARSELQRHLQFRDGFLHNTGTEHSLALEKLPSVIELLIADLDKSLVELEEEITIYSSPEPR